MEPKERYKLYWKGFRAGRKEGFQAGVEALLTIFRGLTLKGLYDWYKGAPLDQVPTDNYPEDDPEYYDGPNVIAVAYGPRIINEWD
jgi:hypothetical protein